MHDRHEGRRTIVIDASCIEDKTTVQRAVLVPVGTDSRGYLVYFTYHSTHVVSNLLGSHRGGAVDEECSGLINPSIMFCAVW